MTASGSGVASTDRTEPRTNKARRPRPFPRSRRRPVAASPATAGRRRTAGPRRDPHVGARSTAMSDTDDDSATASDVEGPLYVDDPPWREKPVRVYDDYEGMGEADVLFVRGSVRSVDGDAAARRGHRHLADGAFRGATTSGTSASRSSTSAGAGKSRSRSGAYEFQTMLPKPDTVPTEGPVGRYLEVVGQHPWRPAHIHFKVDAPGHEPLVTQVFFPDDPYLENDTIGAVKPASVRPVEPEGDHLVCPFDIVCGRRREPLRELRRWASAGSRRWSRRGPSGPVAASPSSGRDAARAVRRPAAHRRARSRSPRYAAARRAAPGQDHLRRAELPRARREGATRPDYPVAVPEVRRRAGRRRASRLRAAGVRGGRLRGRDGARHRPARCGASRATRRSAAVAGYTVANDVTMRDYQYKTHQWLQGKTWEHSTPLGPFLVTPDEVGDPTRSRSRSRSTARRCRTPTPRASSSTSRP